MTNATQVIPRFPSTTHGHPALRAGVILALCASLLVGFLASSSRRGAPSARTASDVTSVACDHAAASRDAC